MQQYTQNFVLQKYGKYWFLLFFSILFEKIMFYAQKKVKLWIYSLISIIEKNATNNFFSSKYHRRKIIISTFLKCFTLHWLEYLVHFFTLSTNDDIKTPIFIARIYCIGSFFKPKKNPFLHSMKFPQMNIIYYATATLPEMICREVVTTMWMH